MGLSNHAIRSKVFVSNAHVPERLMELPAKRISDFAILREAEKCIPVCANCHRKIHKYGLENVRNALVAER